MHPPQSFRMSSPARQRGWAYVALALLLAVGPAAARGQEDSPFNISLALGWQGYYRPLEWTPAEISITARIEEPFDGLIRLRAQQDDLTNMTVVHPLVVTPGLPAHAPLVVKLAPMTGRCRLDLAERRSGRLAWSHRFDFYGDGLMTPATSSLGHADLLIGHIGRLGGHVLRLGQHSYAVDAQNVGYVRVGSKLPRMAPWDWTGYASLDVLLLYDPDWRQWRREQAAAIVEWLEGGGRIMLVLGTNVLPHDNALGRALPLTIGAQVSGPLGEAAAQLGLPPEVADANTVVTHWQLAASGEGPENEPNAGPRLVNVGLGQALVLPFDPGNLGLEADASAQMWVNLLQRLLPAHEVEVESIRRMSRQSWGQDTEEARTRMAPDGCLRSIVYAAEGAEADRQGLHITYMVNPGLAGLNGILGHLLAIPELRPLSIWWVVGLLTALALLLGPVDYFVLKRLDRQPLTWLTTGGWIALFTLGAYYGVQALRSGEIQLRAVSITDVAPDGRQAWQTSYVGLFAPRTDVYRLTDLAPRQWFSAISPTMDMYLGRGGGAETGGRELLCLQRDGGNQPQSVPVSIWSMQCLMAEGAGAAPPVAVTVEHDAKGRYAVTIDNRSDYTFDEAYILLPGEQRLLLDSIPARQTSGCLITAQRGSPFRIPDDSAAHRGYYSHRGYSNTPQLQANLAYSAQGVLGRSLQIERLRREGAAIVHLRARSTAAPMNVADYDCQVDHIEMFRLIVYPRLREVDYVSAYDPNHPVK